MYPTLLQAGSFPVREVAASTFADQMEPIFWVITLLTILFTAIVLAALVFFSIKYRRGARVDRSRPVHTDLRLELAWSVGPLIIGIGIYIWAAIPFASIFVPPKDAEEVLVIGKRWMWHVQHSNGLRENNELHVPTGRKIKLTLISQDVLHDFYVPAFRLKRDAIPGRYTSLWFEATTPGRYHLFCMEYCGMGHSQMAGWVTVMSPKDYQAWLKTGGVRTESALQTPQEQGADLYQRLNCVSCHGAGANLNGPSLVGIYNTKRQLLNGRIVNADDEYLRGAILEPEKYPLQGYPNVLMPSYKGNLTEEQTFALIAYIKTLKPNNGVSITETKSGDAPSGAAGENAGIAVPANRPIENGVGNTANTPGASNRSAINNNPNSVNIPSGVQLGNSNGGPQSGPARIPNPSSTGPNTRPGPQARPHGETIQ